MFNSTLIYIHDAHTAPHFCLWTPISLIKSSCSLAGTQGRATIGNGDNALLHFLKEPPHRVVVAKSESLSLPCTAAGGPNDGAINITWYKDGVVVRDGRHYKLRSDGTLRFKRVGHKLDGSIYQCEASSSLGAILSRKARLYLAGMWVSAVVLSNSGIECISPKCCLWTWSVFEGIAAALCY